MPLSSEEKRDKERMELRQKHKEEFMQSYSLTEKQADDCLDALETICSQYISEYIRKKHAGIS